MGEVYRARDTRLEREVAIKVLPEELADDEERLQRFEREAEALSRSRAGDRFDLHSAGGRARPVGGVEHE
jgi:serine/threonine protein kinase